MCYFSKQTLCHLRLQQGLSTRHHLHSLDIKVAFKLTHVYFERRDGFLFHIESKVLLRYFVGDSRLLFEPLYI